MRINLQTSLYRTSKDNQVLCFLSFRIPLPSSDASTEARQLVLCFWSSICCLHKFNGHICDLYIRIQRWRRWRIILVSYHNINKFWKKKYLCYRSLWTLLQFVILLPWRQNWVFLFRWHMFLYRLLSII